MDKKQSGKGLIRQFFNSERCRFVVGLVVFFVTIYIGLSLISFFFTGYADQSKIENVPLADLLLNHGKVENWTGVRGAYISDLLMNRLFGVPSFMILFFLGSVGIKLMNLAKISLFKRFLFSASVLIWASVFFAFIFVSGYEDTSIYLGGRHGYDCTQILMANIGIPGTFLLLLGGFLLIAIFTSKRTVPFLQNMLSLSWLHKYIPKLKEKKTQLKEAWAERKQVEENQDVVEDSEKEKSEPETKSETKKLHLETTNAVDKSHADNPVEIVVADNPDEKEVKTDNFEVKVAPEEEMADSSVQLEKYNPRLDLSNYKFPDINLLKVYDTGDFVINREELDANQQMIKQTLEDFGIRIASIKATVGPTVTLYEIVPEAGVRISKIKNLEDDIALSLSALQIRIIAPMPGKGTIGIEVPNKNPRTVSMHSVIASKKFQECSYALPIAIGRTIVNEVFLFDLCKAPHLLVAGATGQGKSVGLNAIITSLLYKKHPSELKFVMIDPKQVEFSIYAKIERHYLAKLPNADKAIVTEPEDAVATLNSLVVEMENRYSLLVGASVRNIKEYNEKFISRKLNPEKGHRFLPYIVVVVDEFADLIATSGREIEMPISRIAAKARAVGIHMILATQRPDTKVITGTIKSNFPSRVAFKVMSQVDSRTILDMPGANRLIGKGDMLILITGNSEPTRVQCSFVDTPEVENIVDHIGSQVAFPTAYILPECINENSDSTLSGTVDLSERDVLFEEAARLIVIQQQGSTSLIQRKFAIGYNRAGRLMDQLEAVGIVGPFEGSKARQVLIPDEYSLEQLLNTLH